MAAQAATLAAIAQTTSFDLEAVSKQEDEVKWREFCVEMRDAAGSLNAAARGKDQPAAAAAAKRLAKTCDACHGVFRQE